MNPLAQALGNKLGQASNFVQGKSVVNNLANPNSAASKLKASLISVPQQQANQTTDRRMMRPYYKTNQQPYGNN